MTAPLPKSIERYLRGHVRRQRGVALLRSAGQAGALAVGVMLAACTADRMFHLAGIVRLGLLLMMIAGAVAILIRPLLRAITGRIGWLEAAAGLERRKPEFAERLQTVVSQLLYSPTHRGSPSMLDRLVQDVTREVEQDRIRFWEGWPAVAGPWGLTLALLVLLGQLALVPSVGMATLLSRFFMPLADVLPATTTRIAVEPGNTAVRAGDALAIQARVARLGDSSVDLLTSQDRASWARIPMQAIAENQYAVSLPAPQRDFYYCLQGGDATTPVYKVTILRPPAVAAFRVRYEYPAYMRRGERAVSGTDALIEAIVGTTVHLSLVCTEPMASASLMLDGQKLAMRIGADPHVCQTEFVLRKSQKTDVDLTSAGGMSATTTLTLRAQPDRQPMVRLIQPADDQRLNPRDLLQLQYAAADDCGLTLLAAVVQVNANPPVQLPIRPGGDPRQQEGQCLLDLGSLNVKVGDVLALSLMAQDGAGAKVHSETRRILISPRSIDTNTHRRIAELRQASRLADGTQRALNRTAIALEQVRRAGESGGDVMAAKTAVSGALADAVEQSLLLHQVLLRVCAKSGPNLQTTALASIVDQSRVLVWQCERLTQIDTVDASETIVARELKKPTDAASRLGPQLKTIADGEQAAALLADRTNLRAQPTSPPTNRDLAERLNQTLRRAQQETDAAIVQLGLQPQAADLDAKLQQKVDAAEQLIRSLPLLDVATLAVEWSAAVQRTDVAVPSLAERLASASAVEAIRPDAEPIIARDWQLAGRAAERIGQLVLAHSGDDPGPIRQLLDALPKAIAALQREHQMIRQPGGSLSLEQLGITRQEAAAARVDLARWAKQTDLTAAEELAMEASALTARRDYTSAEALDRALAARVRPEGSGGSWRWDAIDRAMARARNIDRLSLEQQDVVEQTMTPWQDASMTLSQRQRQIAEKIGSTGEARNRESGVLRADAIEDHKLAGEVIAQVQERLALMPQQLARVQEAAETHRQQAARAAQAMADAKNASGPRLPAAQRAAEQADRALRQAREQLTSALTPLAAEDVDRIVQRLRQVGPETDLACQRMTAELRPALALLEQATRQGDRGAVNLAARRVREAIEATQAQLRQSQASMMESDPLAAAAWYARMAARWLGLDPSNLDRAVESQQDAALSLEKAWREAVRESATERLAATPQFRSILTPLAGMPGNPALNNAGDDALPSLRPWGAISPWQPQNLTAPLHETDPHGYQDALRVYFEALGKAQEQGSRR